MPNELVVGYNKFLEQLAMELDIPPSKYQQAMGRFKSVKDWLEVGEYSGCTAVPRIYMQGSFRLGTVVRPIRDGKESDYDIDLVCELQAQKPLCAPRGVKSVVGDRLKENAIYNRMLDPEGRRCWTLDYSEDDGIGFHMDVLPSVPEGKNEVGEIARMGVPQSFASSSIAITHKEGEVNYLWKPSNPEGYAEWFERIKQPIYERVRAAEKKALFESNRGLFATADAVPDQLVRTPLQRVIQLLKRHRDMRFVGHAWEDAKPISMIITTLAARLYRSESDVYSALNNIVERLDEHAQLLKPVYGLSESLASHRLIERKSDGKWYIPNPVNPAENFADRWHENDHCKARAFFLWVSWAKEDLIDVLSKVDLVDVNESVQRLLGGRVGLAAAQSSIAAPAIITASRNRPEPFEIKDDHPPKPWCPN
jgi:hypothetical protein